MATLMENMLRMHQFGLGGGVGGDGVEGEEAVEMVEGRLEEDIEEGQEHNRMAQEQEDVRAINSVLNAESVSISYLS